MNWMQLASGLTASLAWPIAAVTIVVLFRKTLATLMASLLKIKLPGGIEAEFSKELGQVVAVVATAQAAPAGEPGTERVIPFPEQPASTTVNLLDLMEPPADPRASWANPTGVVMEGWKSLEALLRNICDLSGPNVHLSRRIAFDSVLKFLSHKNFVTSEEADTLRKLKKMRDLAAHSQEPIAEESAIQFAEITERLTKIFSKRVSQIFPSTQSAST
jgi:hypothetical protein